MHPDLLLKIIAHYESSTNFNIEVNAELLSEAVERKKVYFMIEGSQANCERWNEYIDG